MKSVLCAGGRLAGKGDPMHEDLCWRVKNNPRPLPHRDAFLLVRLFCHLGSGGTRVWNRLMLCSTGGRSSVASKVNLLFIPETQPQFGTFSYTTYTTLRSPKAPLQRELNWQKHNYLLNYSFFCLVWTNTTIMVISVCDIKTSYSCNLHMTWILSE